MKKLLALATLLQLTALSADIDWAKRITCELQTAGPASLPTLTLTQGSSPLIAADQYRSGRALTVTNDTIAILRFAPNITNTLWVSVTNYSYTSNSYLIQCPSLGTNAQNWVYTIVYEKEGNVFWTGNGRLDITASTATGTPLSWTTIPQGISSNGVVAIINSHNIDNNSHADKVTTNRTITVNGVTGQLSSNLSFTVTALGDYLPLSGGTMSGNIDMDTNSISGRSFGPYAGYGAYGSFWSAYGDFSGYSASGIGWTTLGRSCGSFASGISWSAVGYSAGFQGSGTNWSAIGVYAGRTSSGNNRLYIDVYDSDPMYLSEGATNDMIFGDNGYLTLGRGAGAPGGQQGGTLRGPWIANDGLTLGGVTKTNWPSDNAPDSLTYSTTNQTWAWNTKYVNTNATAELNLSSLTNAPSSLTIDNSILIYSVYTPYGINYGDTGKWTYVNSTVPSLTTNKTHDLIINWNPIDSKPSIGILTRGQ